MFFYLTFLLALALTYREGTRFLDHFASTIPPCLVSADKTGASPLRFLSVKETASLPACCRNEKIQPTSLQMQAP